MKTHETRYIETLFLIIMGSVISLMGIMFLVMLEIVGL